MHTSASARWGFLSCHYTNVYSYALSRAGFPRASRARLLVQQCVSALPRQKSYLLPHFHHAPWGLSSGRAAYCEGILFNSSRLVSRFCMFRPHCSLRPEAEQIRLCRVNITLGPKEDRILITGLHTVADVYCSCCQSILGWKYVSSFFRIPPCMCKLSLFQGTASRGAR